MLRVDSAAPVTGYLLRALKQQDSELKVSLKAWEIAIVLGCGGDSRAGRGIRVPLVRGRNSRKEHVVQKEAFEEDTRSQMVRES